MSFVLSEGLSYGLIPEPDRQALHSVKNLESVCSKTTNLDEYPLAVSIEQNIPIYDVSKPFEHTRPEYRGRLRDEWRDVLKSGPGVFVLKGLYTNPELIDTVSGVFHDVIAEEKKTLSSHGDHFAGAGQNDRIWNAFSKHGLADPVSFLAYYSNPYLSLVSYAWLGPGYRITAQVNNVKPGSEPQVCHRDYHLGFMPRQQSLQYQPGMQMCSQFLTLQGAVAHVDIPVESGPTRLLPFSQLYSGEFTDYKLPEYNEYFLQNYVSLPLEKGDGLFFNPMLMHAAGSNQSTDINRLANLLQISSPFGKPMEAIDTRPLLEACWEELLRLYEGQGLSDRVKAFISALGEGYPFPTNLDRNPPQGVNATPSSEQEVILRCLQNHESKVEALKAFDSHRQASKA